MNKKEKTEKCREILYKYEIGKKVNDLKDFNFLIDIFEGHTEYENKIGCGLDFISIQKTMYGQRCFYLHRIDGTSTDISFVHSITNRTDLFKIKQACRHSIRNIIVEFRNKNVVYGISKCPITNELLFQNNTHIDHFNLTFNDLFNLWIAKKDIKKLSELINKTEDNNLETYFTCEKTINDFIKFHNENTNLRFVSKNANLSILKN